MKTDVLKILGKIIPTAIFVLLLPFSIIYMAISKVCSFIRKVNTQFRAYPFYKASEWMPHKKLLLNSIVF